MISEELEEEKLWDNFLRGDGQCFERIYQLHYSNLVNYARRFTSDITLLEECVQDLFVKLWKNRGGLGRPASVRHYLLKALRNIIYNRFAAARRELSVGAGNDLLDFEFAFQAPGTGGTEGHAAELSERVRKILAVLTPRQKEAVYLFYFEDMSYRQIADLLNMQVGAAYKLIYRAIDNIRSHAELYSFIAVLSGWL